MKIRGPVGLAVIRTLAAAVLGAGAVDMAHRGDYWGAWAFVAFLVAVIATAAQAAAPE